jgi:aminopeptidase S
MSNATHFVRDDESPPDMTNPDVTGQGLVEQRLGEEILMLSAALPRARTRIGIVIAAVTLGLVSACGSTVTETPNSDGQVADGPLAQKLASEVSDAGAMVHLQALQKIADENGGNRAAGSPGYEASVNYVVGVLRGAGYDVSTPSYELSEEDSGDSGPATPRNVIAQTRGGDPAHVVMMGAHLDSVPKGPGVVDDGSGVASLLEIATHLGVSPPVQNAVRFAFFGNEETGSQGSTGYVQSLTTEDRQKILLYLNVDMVASPNAGYFAQGGKGDDKSSAGPPGSASVGRVLAAQLAKTGVTPEIIEFVGDDESSFIDADIPSGGAENGDRKKKTAEQAQAWGGQAGEAYDHCYHTACDRVDNVNRDVLNHYLHALAGTVAHFATSNEQLSR